MTKYNNQNYLEQKQKLQEIGTNLYRIRTEKGISLDTIAEETAIAKRILVAIEQGETEHLPEPFYTLALIKKYASALGVTDIPDYTVVSDSEPKPIKRPLMWFSGFRLHSIHLYLLYLLLVGISVRIIAFNVVDNQLISTNETLVTSTLEPKNSEVIRESLDSISNPSQLVSQSNNEVTVDIDLKDRCWMKVIVDGKVIFEGTLPAGTHRTWKGKKQVTIIAGNAGGVVVTYNHGTEKLLGKPGQVQEVTYTVN
ncbi:MAG: helix-turn-helix domain-containing protein [Xenococcaceae cyanobacterium MO_188.B19]|nr:helix-turn-helix domain-containing protein [Xenococcaceae cyanobacterium MO_188.B19]MDJ0682557.1 helix-turn-helix domain-containing protein [Xenococcaceae cyanobacterium MO_167.B52]